MTMRVNYHFCTCADDPDQDLIQLLLKRMLKLLKRTRRMMKITGIYQRAIFLSEICKQYTQFFCEHSYVGGCGWLRRNMYSANSNVSGFHDKVVGIHSSYCIFVLKKYVLIEVQPADLVLYHSFWVPSWSFSAHRRSLISSTQLIIHFEYPDEEYVYIHAHVRACIDRISYSVIGCQE